MQMLVKMQMLVHRTDAAYGGGSDDRATDDDAVGYGDGVRR